MNFLAHHAVAVRRVAAAGGTARQIGPNFYVGNVLPDLISMSGVPRLRAQAVSALDSALATGIRLHFESDRVFHASPEFAASRSLAKSLLQSAPFTQPPERMFFLTHVFVEIALDSYILRETPSVADDFYEKFESAEMLAVVAEVKAILETDRPLTELSRVLERFLRHRFLFEYACSEGCAGALGEICRRAGVGGFHSPHDHSVLAGAFETFGEIIPDFASGLLGTECCMQSVVQ